MRTISGLYPPGGADSTVTSGVCALAVGQPASTFLFGEEADTALGGTDDAYFLAGSNAPSDRHNGGCNFVFLDGHAKWLTKSAIIYPNPSGSYCFEP